MAPTFVDTSAHYAIADTGDKDQKNFQFVPFYAKIEGLTLVNNRLVANYSSYSDNTNRSPSSICCIVLTVK